MRGQAEQICYTDGDLESTGAVLSSLYQTGASIAHFDNIDDCLKAIRDEGCRLLVSNVPRPEEEGLELLARVRRLAPSLPVIMLVGRGQIRTAVLAMRAGATDCLERPPRGHELRSILETALRDAPLGRKPTPLSDTERTVLQLVLEGRTSREIATRLQRSRRTVEVHRRHICDKLGAEGTVDLMRKALTAGLLHL